ncbi:LysR family transcriptional regulator [Marinobacter sp. X15-166B]|uniref:LysR family transcriptional regulator n=1 Tax=Marinobacter sp. X15-166B TaxID=1897620 RepID=UPI00085C3B7F|nr:LysR family transcriptional regulator [Marinobacter sp. X15-166B]OEY67050.1 LysR family transcriptional regulator [Marinobacter sp. X15-166B]
MQQFNPRALEYLNAVKRFGSIRKAAARLNVDPSAISRQISQLEDTVGMAVWDRMNTSNPVTPAGAELLRYYKQMKASEAATLSRLQDLIGLRTGDVRIAVGEGFISDLISSSLQSFLTAYTGIHIDVEIAGAKDAVQMLEDDQIDFAVTYAPARNPKMHCLVEKHHPLDLITPYGHPLSRTDTPLTFSDIVNTPLALIDSSTGIGRLVSLVQEVSHVRLEPRLKTNSVAVVKNFVTSGMGITFMPRLTVIGEIRARKISTVTMAHSALSQARVCVLCVKGRELTLAAQAFLDHLKQSMSFLMVNADEVGC